MGYTDAEKLKRFVESIGLTPQKSADYNDGRNVVKMMVLDFIDSLHQEQDVDLEKEIKDTCRGYWINDFHEQELGKRDIENIARHFYELGKNSK